MGAPAGLDPVVMFYENIRFKVASATPPDPDYTLEDFLASAGKINNQGASLESGSYSYGFCTTPLSDDPVFFAHLFDGGLFDSISAPTQPELNSTANVEAIQWYATLWSEHALAPKVTDNIYQTYQQVGATSCGYWMNWLDMFGFGAGLAVQPRVLPLPRVDESSGTALSSPAFLDGYFITKYSPNPEAAWKWINFLLERQEASLNLIPPLTWQIESDEYAQRVSPDVLAVAQRLPSNMPFLSLDVFNDPRSSLIQNVFSNAVRDVVEGKAEPQAALDEAQAKAEEIFNSPATQDARP
jgi:ABC-type glycerol-3-phosphate transport system substrate-binding protein